MKVGIDPGLNGAIAFYQSPEKIWLFDMPTRTVEWKKPKIKKVIRGRGPTRREVKEETHKMRVDVRKLAQWIRNAPHPVEKVSLEIVHSMPRDGVASAFSFGGAFYSALSAVELAGHDPVMVFPQAWKGPIGLVGTSKDAARVLALEKYPQLAEKLKFKKNVDRADALWIALHEFKLKKKKKIVDKSFSRR